MQRKALTRSSLRLSMYRSSMNSWSGNSSGVDGGVDAGEDASDELGLQAEVSWGTPSVGEGSAEGIRRRRAEALAQYFTRAA